MDRNWDISDEIEHFREIWTYRRSGHAPHTKENWDARAEEWVRELKTDAVFRENSVKRVDATIRYLRARGLLTETEDVIDIGCGPGQFVTGFAKHCRLAVGTDLSPRMLAYGAQYAKEAGLENVSYVEADFQKADIDALGWRKRFDLVFSSITPAIGGETGLDKLIQMSRGYCFNSCFVYFEDALENELAERVLGVEKIDSWNSHWHWYYALFNLLWLDGYYPETTYYKEEEASVLPADPETARSYAEKLAETYGRNREELERPVLSYLKEKAGAGGNLVRKGACWYGWLLWDVRTRTGR